MSATMYWFKITVDLSVLLLVVTTGTIMGTMKSSPPTDKGGQISESMHAQDTMTLPSSTVVGKDDAELIALPNPVLNRHEKVLMMCRTRCVGRALVNIYDATGSMVYETTVELKNPDAVGYRMCIPWDCRNRMGRFVGNGNYLGVVRIFDAEERPVARHMVHIGVAY